MSVKTRALRLLALLMALLLLSLSAGFAWAAADDFSVREIVPESVSVAGHDLGGLTREEARAAIDEHVAAPLFEPVDVTFEGRTFELDPAAGLSIDVDTMLESAFSPLTGATVAERAYRKLAQKPVAVEIDPVLAVDEDALGSWVSDVASQIDTPSVDATVTLEAGVVVMGEAEVGYLTERQAAHDAVVSALLEGEKHVELPVEIMRPKVTEEDLGSWLKVVLSERRVHLYNGTEIVKSYPIAIGTPSFPTPRGAWEITAKRYRPTWGNPGSAWAADMPKSIPPGPGNPLGTRAINLSASGIRFHGTTATWSVGRAASHGCMRMLRRDIEDLYERVEVGDKVFIVR